MPSASQERTAADHVLAAERAHLRQSRDYLGLMRTDVLSLRAMGGDPVSEEYLKADLYRRAEALRDLPDTPLFFGRLDYRAGALEGTSPDDAHAADDARPPSTSISAGGMCTIRMARRSSSTGARRCRGRSTGRARPTRWGWSSGAGSASTAASSRRSRTSCSVRAARSQ